MENMNNENQYITKDLGEAAALLTASCVMRDLQWNGNKAFFYFDNKEACKVLADQYFFGGLELPVRSFYENLRIIKRKLMLHYAEEGAKNKGGDL